MPSSGVVGTTDPDAFLGLSLPIAGIAGDQQAALFGQACYSPGMSKCTYGTGSFVLTNTGSTPVRSDAGLLTTVAWDIGDGLVYALEGAIFVTGAAVQWLRDGLGLIDSAAEIEGLARTVPDSGDVVFVPALTGMGAPHWDPHARGAIVGITRGTTRAHLARATLEAISFEVRDVVDVMVDRGRARGAGALGRRRRQRERPADAAAGRPARRPGAPSGGHRDDGAGRGVPRRSGHRRVGVDRRARADLGAGPPVRARGRTPGRRPARPLAQRPPPRREVDLLSELITERLLLRPVTAEHVAAVTAGRRLAGWAPDFPSEGDEVIAGMLDRNGVPVGPDTVFGQRLVVERDTGLVVGGIGLFGPPENGRVELGYGIVESRRGRGYATEAARAMVQLALDLPGVTEVVAGVDPANAASVRVLEKAGLTFRSQRRRRGAVRRHGHRAGSPRPVLSDRPSRHRRRSRASDTSSRG